MEISLEWGATMICVGGDEGGRQAGREGGREGGNPMEGGNRWREGTRGREETRAKPGNQLVIIYKQDMWWVYKHTGKDKDNEVYKEALNEATNEVRKS